MEDIRCFLKFPLNSKVPSTLPPLVLLLKALSLLLPCYSTLPTGKSYNSSIVQCVIILSLINYIGIKVSIFIISNKYH
jgi:hypothetical protein